MWWPTWSNSSQHFMKTKFPELSRYFVFPEISLPWLEKWKLWSPSPHQFIIVSNRNHKKSYEIYLFIHSRRVFLCNDEICKILIWGNIYLQIGIYRWEGSSRSGQVPPPPPFPLDHYRYPRIISPRGSYPMTPVHSCVEKCCLDSTITGEVLKLGPCWQGQWTAATIVLG